MKKNTENLEGQTISTKISLEDKNYFIGTADEYNLNPSQALTRLIYFFNNCTHEERLNLINKYHDPKWPKKK